METDPFSKTFRFLTIWNSGWWTRSKNPVIISVVIHHSQNPLNSVSSVMYVFPLISSFNIPIKESFQQRSSIRYMCRSWAEHHLIMRAEIAQSVKRRALDWTTGVRLPARDFSLPHIVQASSEVLLSSYLKSTESFSPWVNTAGLWSWPLTSTQCWSQEYLHTPLRLHYRIMHPVARNINL
jgi:hypothetical protein